MITSRQKAVNIKFLSVKIKKMEISHWLISFPYFESQCKRAIKRK